MHLNRLHLAVYILGNATECAYKAKRLTASTMLQTPCLQRNKLVRIVHDHWPILVFVSLVTTRTIICDHDLQKQAAKGSLNFFAAARPTQVIP